MTRSRSLAAADVMALNDEILGRMHGTQSLVRDENALESAMMRPQMAAYYEGADLVAQAATLMAGIALAHAFADGNKRTAFAAGRVYMTLNALTFTGDVLELAQQIESIVVRKVPLPEALAAFTDWLRVRVPTRPRA